jgi:hypothetical protein
MLGIPVGEASVEARQAMAVLAKAVGMSSRNTDEVYAKDMLVPFRVCEDLPLLLLGMAHAVRDPASRRELGAVRQSLPANPWVTRLRHFGTQRILTTKCK